MPPDTFCIRLRTVLALFTLLLTQAAGAADWVLTLTRIEVKGSAVSSVELAITPPGAAQAVRRMVHTKEAFVVGTTIAAPAQTTLTLTSSHTNEIKILPGGSLKITAGGEYGEEYTPVEGEFAFNVRRALSFFTVRYRNFQALVHGTRYSVNVVPEKTISFGVDEGTVRIDREGKLKIDEGDIEKPIASSEFLRAGDSKTYHLDLDEYLARFQHFDDAEQYYRANLARDQQSGDPDQIEIGLNQLGLALFSLSQYQAAIPYFQQCLDSAKQRHPSGVHGKIADSLNNLGNAYWSLGGTANLERAIGYHEESLKLRRQLYPSGVHRDIADSLNNLGNAYSDLGGTANLERAIGYHEESLKLERQLDPTRTRVADTLGGLSYQRLFVGQYTQALADAREALQINPALNWIRTNEAHALLLLGQEAEALAIYRAYRDKPVNAQQQFPDAVLDDFKALRKAGIDHPGMAKVEALYAAPATR